MLEKATIEATSLVVTPVPKAIQNCKIIVKTPKKGNENVSTHENALEKPSGLATIVKKQLLIVFVLRQILY